MSIVYVGYNVSWRLAGTRIARPDLQAALTAAGFATLMPKREPTPKRALKRAIGDWIAQRTGQDVPDSALGSDEGEGKKSWLIRVIKGQATKKQAAWVIYALVGEAPLVKAMGLRFATSYRFAYIPASSRLVVSTAGQGEIGAEDERIQVTNEIEPLWEHHRQLYLAGDVSRILTDAMDDMRGIPLRDGGGYYFVPSDSYAALDRLQAFVAALPVTGRQQPALFAFPQVNEAETTRQLREAAFLALQEELAKAESDIQRFVMQDAEKPGSVRPGTVQSLLADYLRLRDKAQLYQETLGLRHERVQATLSDLDTLEATAQAFGQRRAGRATSTPLTFDAPAAPTRKRRAS